MYKYLIVILLIMPVAIMAQTDTAGIPYRSADPPADGDQRRDHPGQPQEHAWLPDTGHQLDGQE
jgi:hypothetical protein